MNRRLYRFVGTLFLGLAASYARADIYYTPGGGPFDVTLAPGTYFIEAAGAQGGGTESGAVGGLGAVVGGYVTINATEELAIVAGGQGNSGSYVQNNGNQSSGGGGGGGSFVYLTALGGDGVTPLGSNPLLLVAGGGGGAAGSNAGDPGQINEPGDAGSGTDGGAGGTGGNGGYGSTNAVPTCAFNGDCGGGGGGGWFSNGVDTRVFQEVLPNVYFTSNGAPGSTNPFDYAEGAYSGGTNGNNYGGYGGGGGGGALGGGGGGGYSGGGGGCGCDLAVGGGGGSYTDAVSSVSPVYPYDTFTDTAGANAGDGFVIVTPVPEPSSVILLLTELLTVACIAFVARRRIVRSNR
jgi:hypothetical protein